MSEQFDATASDATANGADRAQQEKAAVAAVNGKDHSAPGVPELDEVSAAALAAMEQELADARAKFGADGERDLREMLLATDVRYPDLRQGFHTTHGLPLGEIDKLHRKIESERKKAERKFAGVEKDERAKAAAAAAVLPVGQRNFLDLTDAERQQEAARTLPLCEDVARDPDILKRADDLLTGRGVVGEQQIKRAGLLAGVARLFPVPVNLIVKGPSASGKNYTLRAVLSLLPPGAVLWLTDMSERALVDLPPGSLRHRIVGLEEATPIQKDDHSPKALYLRALMSGDRIEYARSEKDPKTGKMVTRIIVQEGPAGCIVTTTASRLHNENETRAITIETDDTQRQTSDILLAIAERRNVVAACAVAAGETATWHAFFRYIEVTGPHVVSIPYLDWLALNTDTSTIRMRRDFSQLVSLIEASAVLHRATRGIQSPGGEIVATEQDYANAVDIIGKGADQAAGRAVSRPEAAVWRVVHELVNQKVDEGFKPVPGSDLKAAAAARAEGMLRARVPLSGADLKKRTGRSLTAAQRDLETAVGSGVIVREPTKAGITSTYGLGVPRLPRGLHGVFPSAGDLSVAGSKEWEAAAREAAWRRGPGGSPPDDDEAGDADETERLF